MKRRVTVLLVIAAFALMWLSGGLHGRLLEARRRETLSGADPLESAPPLVVFTTVVLGGFRGLMADLLWLRASELQDRGRYFELMQLSDWITKLEPRSTEIWGYHAWNMAYNVSIMMADPQDRWRWVQNGIRLLRDRGLVYNPGAPKLYCELGWLYQHKIGGYTDETHAYYKERLAAEMTELLGEGGLADYSRIAADTALAKRLRDELKLDPEIMRRVDEAYGPLDWRGAATHALYWAYRGRLAAGATPCLPCDRMIYQAMVMSFYRGRLVVEREQGALILETAPEPRLLPGVMRAFAEAEAAHGRDAVRVAWEGFLVNAVAILYASGRVEESRAAFDTLRQRFLSTDRAVSFEEFLQHGPTVKMEGRDGG